MKLRVILISTSFILILFAFVKAEVKPLWTKEIGRYVAHVSFSGNGKLVAAGVNNTPHTQGFVHACTLFCLNSSDGLVLWKKGMTGEVFYTGFLAGDKYLFVYTGEKFEGGIYDQYDIDFFYVFSQDGRLLWMERDSTHALRFRTFSPDGNLVAKYCDILNFLGGCDSLGYQIALKRIEDGAVTGSLSVKEGIQWTRFVSDTTLLIWTADSVLELRYVNGKSIRKISPDQFCKDAVFSPLGGYLSTSSPLRDIPKGIIVCSLSVYALNERLEVYDTIDLRTAPLLKSKPLNYERIFVGDDAYYFTEDGKLLGKRDNLKGGMIPVAVDSALLDTTFSTPLHEYNTFSSADGKRIAIISKKGNTIRYYSLTNK